MSREFTRTPLPRPGDGGRLPIPVEIRPDIGATVVAHLANEVRLQVGQARVVGPLIGPCGDRMRALSAGNQQAANALSRLEPRVCWVFFHRLRSWDRISSKFLSLPDERGGTRTLDPTIKIACS